MVEPLTATALAAITASALTPYLQAGATEAAKTLGKEVVEQSKKIVSWLRNRLTGSAKEALADLSIKPSEATAATFRRELETTLASQPLLLDALGKLLAEMPKATQFAEQALSQTGENNKAAQVQGNNNKTSIR